MNIVVLLKMVPDAVEELEVGPDGRSLDTEFLRMIVSESDDHALEEALILKEKHGGKVTVLALDAPEIDDTLFAALAKGADRAVKIVGETTGLSTNAIARVLADALSRDTSLAAADLVLTGTQAIDDLDGLTAPLVAHRLGRPFLGIVTGIAADLPSKRATVTIEFPSGVRGSYELPLPAVLGVQSAEKQPRYVPVAKVRAAMKSGRIETVSSLGAAEPVPVLAKVVQMSKPKVLSHAEMLDGEPAEVAGRLSEILSERGLL